VARRDDNDAVGVAVAYPGREGAHSAAACEALFPGAAPTPLPSFADVVEAAASGAVAFGVLPIESSLAGPVNETHDLLYGSPLSITAEAVLPIHHCLVGPAVVPLEELREVHSHPVALDQCRRLLTSMPWAHAVAAGTTADAAAAVAQLGDPSVAAIASERAARLYGLELLADDVGDHPEAFTRFVAVAPYTRLDRDERAWRTAFSFVTDHQPGALHRAIEPFGRHGIDLVQLVSRPIPRTPWRYRFDAVLGGHPQDAEIAGALVELRGLTRELRVFGSYPVATPPRR
jgi:prephenate dehydratase